MYSDPLYQFRFIGFRIKSFSMKFSIRFVFATNTHTYVIPSSAHKFSPHFIFFSLYNFFVSLVVVVVPQPAIFLISISNFTYKRTQYSFIHTFIDRSKQIKTKIISIIYSFPFFSPKTCGTMNKLFNKI